MVSVDLLIGDAGAEEALDVAREEEGCTWFGTLVDSFRTCEGDGKKLLVVKLRREKKNINFTLFPAESLALSILYLT